MKKEKYTLDWFLKEYSELFDELDVSEELVRNKHIEFQNNQPSNSNNKDFFWSFFQYLILETSKYSGDLGKMYSKQRSIYFAMTYFRREHEKSNANEILRLFFKADLKMGRPSRLEMQVVIHSGHCCDYCDSLGGKKFDLDVVLEKEFLASDNCTNKKGCNCCYSKVPKKDKDGNFIRKK